MKTALIRMRRRVTRSLIQNQASKITGINVLPKPDYNVNTCTCMQSQYKWEDKIWCIGNIGLWLNTCLRIRNVLSSFATDLSIFDSCTGHVGTSFVAKGRKSGCIFIQTSYRIISLGCFGNYAVLQNRYRPIQRGTTASYLLPPLADTYRGSTNDNLVIWFNII